MNADKNILKNLQSYIITEEKKVLLHNWHLHILHTQAPSLDEKKSALLTTFSQETDFNRALNLLRGQVSSNTNCQILK